MYVHSRTDLPPLQAAFKTAYHRRDYIVLSSRKNQASPAPPKLPVDEYIILPILGHHQPAWKYTVNRVRFRRDMSRSHLHGRDIKPIWRNALILIHEPAYH